MHQFLLKNILNDIDLSKEDYGFMVDIIERFDYGVNNYSNTFNNYFNYLKHNILMNLILFPLKK